jgi:PAS domain S-box-containing protein
MHDSPSSHDAPVSSVAEESREDLLARIALLEAEVDRLEGRSGAELDDRLAALRDSERRFRAMANTAPAMLWITDEDNATTFLSQRWYEYTGRPAGEDGAFDWLEAVHPDDREEARHNFLAAAADRKSFSLDFRLRRGDGEYRWVIDEGRPRFDDEGEWIGYIGSVIEVHDRREATEALRRSEARYRALFGAIDEGFCVLQMIFDEEDRPIDYRFLETNPAFQKQTGLEDAIGKTVRELLPDLEEHWFEIYGRVARTGESIRFENGSEAMQRWFDVFAFRVDEPELRKVALLFKDISEQKGAEQERKRLLNEAEAARAAAEDANRAKAEFLAAMSHELRTPLNAIGGYVGLLEMGVHGPLTDEQRNALSRIDANQRHLLTHINDVLSFARLEAGSIEFDIGTLSALDLLATMEPLVAPQAAAKDIAYAMEECDPALGLRGDGERVRQILLNLIGNAIKFTPPGGTVTLACRPEAETVGITVEDSGVGIAPEEQERIFDSFQQVDRRLNQPAEGVGLGLAISRDLARAMAGDLTVESEPGEGSTFTLHLPRVDLT